MPLPKHKASLKPALGDKKTNKQKTLFYRQTDGHPKKSQSVKTFFFFFFLFLMPKLSLETQKFQKKNRRFLRQNFVKYFNLFSTSSAKIFKILVQTLLVLQDFGKI